MDTRIAILTSLPYIHAHSIKYIMKLDANVVYYSIDPPLHEVLLKVKSGEIIIIWEYEVSRDDAEIIQSRLGEKDMRTPDVESLRTFIQERFIQFIFEDSLEQEVKFQILRR